MFFYLLFYIVIITFGIVKLVGHLRKKAAEPKTAEEALIQRIQDSPGYFGMEVIAKCYATGNVDDFPGEDKSIPKDLKEAERWYAKALEEQLVLRVEYDMITFECTQMPFQNAVLRYCDGKLFPRNLDKAMSVARYLVRRNVPLGGKLIHYVRDLMEGKEYDFYAADWSGAWRQELQFFKKERERLLQEDNARIQMFSRNTGMLNVVMEHEGVQDLPGRIDWILDMADWPRAGAVPSQNLSGSFREALAFERQGNAKKAVARYRKISGIEAKYRLGHVYLWGISCNEHDKDWERGMLCLRQAAAQGSAMAAYELGEVPSVPDIAARAKTGDLEAIEALGCLFQQGRGGNANPLLAYMIWEEGIRLLRENGDPTEGWRQDALSRLYQRQGKEEKALHWLTVAAQVTKYPPAMYRLCLQPFVRLAPGFVEETMGAAFNAGFFKCRDISMLNYWHSDETVYFEQALNRDEAMRYAAMGQAVRKAKLIVNPKLVATHPDLIAQYDETLETILAEQNARTEEENARRQTGQEPAETSQKELRVSDMPWCIFDEWGRSWEGDFLITGKYNLSETYSVDGFDRASMFLHPFSTVGADSVIIRDEDIAGRKASAGGHTFTW